MTATRTATTPHGTAIRGTIKALRAEGIDISRPVLYGGTDIKGPVLDGPTGGFHCATRYERIEVVAYQGVYGYDADNRRCWLGGVATRMWLVQVAEEPHASEVEAADDLDTMTFPQLMEIARSIKLRGRGVARKPQLIAGIRAHRAA